MGDASDNIPGIPGVGPKTAQKLIAQYDTLENALDHFAEQKGKLKESLEKFRDQALLSKRLATIDINVPLPFEPEVLRIGPRDEPTLRALLAEFEFNAIGRRLFGDSFKAGRGGASGGSDSVPTHSEVAAADPAAESSRRASATEPAAGSAAATSAPQNPPIPPVPVTLRTIDDVKPDYQIVETVSEKFSIYRTKFKSDAMLGLSFDLDPNGAVRGIAVSDRVGCAQYVHFGDKNRASRRLFLAVLRVATPILIGHDLKPGLRAWIATFSQYLLKERLELSRFKKVTENVPADAEITAEIQKVLADGEDLNEKTAEYVD